MNAWRGFAVLTCVMAIGASGEASRAVQGPPTVAAASDLQFALEAIANAFTAETGERVTLVFGSSGNLARQAVNGAPFELFLSADEAFVDKLAEGGYARDRGTLYGIGRIVLFAPRGSRLADQGARARQRDPGDRTPRQPEQRDARH